jgi:GT2 family glycosyltransferase
VIIFGSAVTQPEVFRECAEKGIALAAEPDTRTIAHPAAGSIFRNYNAIMDRAAQIEGIEALVLLHQDSEIQDPAFCAKLRAALADPEVGVVGCVGSLGVRSIAWWEGSVTWASFIHRYTELGGGDFPSLTWNDDDRPPYAQLGEVDTVDGFVLGLSPWVVRNIRFDESLGQLLHGYDFDFCLQVREAGRKVVTADFRAIHYRQLDMVPDPERWADAHIKLAEKWDGRMGIGGGAGSWRDRALRAEADTDAALMLAHMNSLESDARVLELRRAIAETTESLSWRITTPFRWLHSTAPRRRRPELSPRSLSQSLTGGDGT